MLNTLSHNHSPELKSEAASVLPNEAERALNDVEELLKLVDDLKFFLATAPANWQENQIIRRYYLNHDEGFVSCVYWNNLYFITGTDIVRCIVYRFEHFGRKIVERKKFEEGIFSDLRNLKCGVDAVLEQPKLPFLDFLHKNLCLRTQKKQKVFFWFSVPHDRLFLDALERDLKREIQGHPATTTAHAEPALSFRYDEHELLTEQVAAYVLEARGGADSAPPAATAVLNTPAPAAAAATSSAPSNLDPAMTPTGATRPQMVVAPTHRAAMPRNNALARPRQIPLQDPTFVGDRTQHPLRSQEPSSAQEPVAAAAVAPALAGLGRLESGEDDFPLDYFRAAGYALAEPTEDYGNYIDPQVFFTDGSQHAPLFDDYLIDQTQQVTYPHIGMAAPPMSVGLGLNPGMVASNHAVGGGGGVATGVSGGNGGVSQRGLMMAPGGGMFPVMPHAATAMPYMPWLRQQHTQQFTQQQMLQMGLLQGMFPGMMFGPLAMVDSGGMATPVYATDPFVQMFLEQGFAEGAPLADRGLYY